MTDQKKPIAYRLSPVYPREPGGIATAALMQCMATGEVLDSMGGGGEFLAPAFVDELRRGFSITPAAQPFDTWYEDKGSVLWWKLPVTEPPYMGSPLDLGFTVASRLYDQFGNEIGLTSALVGGWPFSNEDEPHLVWQPVHPPEEPR